MSSSSDNNSSSESSTTTSEIESSSSSSLSTTTSTTTDNNKQIYRTWIKKQQVPLGCSILQLFVKENDIIEINQPLFEYKVYNVNHNGVIGDRVGVFLASIYKNLKNNSLCKAKIVKILMSNQSDLISQTNPYHITQENQRIVLHIQYIDTSVKEEITNQDFEPQVPTYTLL
ncbi:predicted protein [Naegleria gruberi]|uniref:Predicted protein n=1 Tax=Naegleria gruberi TaxID=5762 RepID=D2VXY9_NAEGR|nr:uncharacterized protein NAEGRDRAFT_74007 [Naegleria gruberi]EFC38322.1 predicted protein [Naegleria gruberi]|eukprot:XP_002671066.1 predicted protein [Naegleria gruberi strain NEG-M]